MPEIVLTPEMLRSEAQKMTTQKNNLTDTVNKIKTLVDSLEGGWHGKAQQAFVNSFNEKKAVYDLLRIWERLWRLCRDMPLLWNRLTQALLLG